MLLGAILVARCIWKNITIYIYIYTPQLVSWMFSTHSCSVHRHSECAQHNDHRRAAETPSVVRSELTVTIGLASPSARLARPAMS
jgi:hypothetical protein